MIFENGELIDLTSIFKNRVLIRSPLFLRNQPIAKNLCRYLQKSTINLVVYKTDLAISNIPAILISFYLKLM